MSHTIRRLQGTTVTTIAGIPNSPGNNPAGVGSVNGNVARFTQPYGLTMSADYTKLYFTDRGNGKVREIDLLSPQYTVRTIIGSGLTPVTAAGVSATTARLVSAGHLVASATYLYLTDETSNAIYQYNFATNIIRLYAGVVGPPANTVGMVPSARFNQPTGISLNCNGDLYIADKGNNSIKLVDPNTYSPDRYVSNYAGSNDPLQPPPEDVDGAASVARFKGPQAVSVFVKGFIDVADTGNDKIKRISIQDYSLRPWVKLDTADFTYCVYDPADTLNPPCGGNYSGPGIVNSGGIVKFDPAVAGPGIHTLSYTYTLGYCTEVTSQIVTVIPKPNPILSPPNTQVCENQFGVYQLDAGAGFTSYAWFRNSVLQPGSGPSFIVGSPATYSVRVTNSYGCVGGDTIAIAGKVVTQVNISGTDSLCYGGQTILTTSPAGAFIAYEWNTGATNSSIGANTSGDYMVMATGVNGCVDTATFRVTVRNAPMVCMTATTMAGVDMGYGTYSVSTIAGSTANLSGSTDNVKGTMARFNNPWDIYYNNGYLYVTEAQKVRRIRLSDTLVTTFAGSVAGVKTDSVGRLNARFQTPKGIVADRAGNFYVANRDYIAKIDMAKDSVFILAGSDVVSSYLDTIIGTEAFFDDPKDIAIDNFGNIYVADFNNHNIRKVSPSGEVTTYAGAVTSPFIGSNNGVGNAAMFNWPFGVEFDVMGNLYVAEEGGQRIRKISLDRNVTSVAGAYTASGFVSSAYYTSVAGAAARFSNPWNMIADKTGRVFLTDALNRSIRIIDKNNNVTHIAGGTLGGADGAYNVAQFNVPTGITMDPVTENIYVADRSNHKIRKITKNKTVTICSGDSVRINASCSGAQTYAWLPTTGLTNAGIANPIAFPTITTTYIVTVTDSKGCMNTDSITIRVNQKPLAIAGTDTTMCIGASKVMGAAPVAGNTYSWTPTTNLAPSGTVANPTATPTVTRTYTLTVTGPNGCTDTDAAVITITPLPTVNAGQDQTKCSNNAVVTLAGTRTVATGSIWTSSGTGVFANSAALSTTYTPSSADTTAGTVTLTLTTTAGNGTCAPVSDQMVVTFTDAPAVNAGPDQTVCANNSAVTLSGSVRVATGGTWSGGTGTYVPNANALNTVYTPSVAERTS